MKDIERVALEKKITDLSKALANLSKSTEKDARELLLIIRKPGWTTPAELGFTTAILDAMGTQIKLIASMKSGLLKNAREVGR